MTIKEQKNYLITKEEIRLIASTPPKDCSLCDGIFTNGLIIGLGNSKYGLRIPKLNDNIIEHIEQIIGRKFTKEKAVEEMDNIIEIVMDSRIAFDSKIHIIHDSENSLKKIQSLIEDNKIEEAVDMIGMALDTDEDYKKLKDILSELY